MRTVVVTDGRYRSSLAAVRALGDAGDRVVVTQTRAESAQEPAAFLSRCTWQGRWIDGSCKDETYADRLLALLGTLDRPVLFCTGADTLAAVSRRRADFAAVADLLVAPPEVLDALNDKQQVHERARALGIPVPEEFSGVPDRFPVVIKPHCGEKAGLKARDRYTIAHDADEFRVKYAAMQRWDDAPIVQEQVVGPGEGVDLLLGRDSELLCALCHRRIREYPVTGGPSTCCVSFYDERLIADAHRLLASFGFVGMAMVELKGGRVLEVNPRVWGSFPLTDRCGSPYTVLYARAAAGEPVTYTPRDFRTGVKLRFLFNDGLATLGYCKAGRLREALGGVRDFFTVPEALRRRDDMRAYRAYLKNSLKGR